MQQPRRADVRWEWIGEGWEMYSKQMGNWLLISLVAFLISLIPIIPIYIFIFAALGLGSNSNPQDIAQALQQGGLNIMATLALSVVGAVIQAFAYSGYYNVVIKQLRGAQISIGDFFGGMQYFLPMLGITGIMAVITFIGNLFCCLGSIFQFATLGLILFAYPLIVDRGMGTIDALKTSFDFTKQNAFMFILFGIVVHLIGGIGVIVCCVGLIFTTPILFNAVGCAYRDCFMSQSTPAPDSYSPPPPPNYGGFEPPAPPPSSWQ
jgi:hypothetical protein